MKERKKEEDIFMELGNISLIFVECSYEPLKMRGIFKIKLKSDDFKLKKKS